MRSTARREQHVAGRRYTVTLSTQWWNGLRKTQTRAEDWDEWDGAQDGSSGFGARRAGSRNRGTFIWSTYPSICLCSCLCPPMASCSRLCVLVRLRVLYRTCPRVAVQVRVLSPACRLMVAGRQQMDDDGDDDTPYNDLFVCIVA